MAKLSILIPARNEEFLHDTLLDLMKHCRGNTEIVVGLDGWMPKFIEDFTFSNNRLFFMGIVEVFYAPVSIGQRAMTNRLAEIATGKYVMKLDAHVSFSEGFDVEMMSDMQDDVTLVPALCNLHAYDWVCENGHRHFQGKYEQCDQCGSTNLHKDIIFKPIAKPIMSSFCFDTTLHFQYCDEQSQDLLSETMSLQGSCFMVSRETYFAKNLCDESLGSWGSQGTEVACKTWLSGGRVLSTKKAFYGHQFRETEGFPYLNPVEGIFHARGAVQDMFLGNKWPQQVRSIQWLIEKFGYQQDWTPEKVEEICVPWQNRVV